MEVKIPSNAYTCEIQVRWNDTDMFGHINNARYITWLEAARLKWWTENKHKYSQPRVRGIMAHVDIDYISAAKLHDMVFVSMWISRLGTKSHTTSYVIHGKDRDTIYATANTVIVAYDFDKDKSIPIPEWYRKVLGQFMASQ